MAQVSSSRTADRFVVVLTGPECTGKSTLAVELAVRLGATVSPEFARIYVDRKGVPLGPSDVEPIAHGQMAVEDEAGRTSVHSVVKDTDLVSTVVYAHHYYRECPAWVERAARERLGHLYLLLAPDVPWLADGFQRDRPEYRIKLYDSFGGILRLWHAHLVEIGGTWDERRAQALTAVASACGP